MQHSRKINDELRRSPRDLRNTLYYDASDNRWSL